MFSKNFHYLMLLISCSLLITANIPNENNIKLIESDMSEKDLSGLVKILNYNTVEAGQNPEWKEKLYKQINELGHIFRMYVVAYLLTFVSEDLVGRTIQVTFD